MESRRRAQSLDCVVRPARSDTSGNVRGVLHRATDRKPPRHRRSTGTFSSSWMTSHALACLCGCESRTFFTLALSSLFGARQCTSAQNTLKIKVDAGEPQWIWSPKHAKDKVPPESCYFRKSFTMGDVEQGKVQITCDDRYDLYVNGRLVGSGTEWQKLKSYDIQRFLRERLEHDRRFAPKTPPVKAPASSPALRCGKREAPDVSHSTDATWRTSDHETVGWEKPGYDDAAWPQRKCWASLATLRRGAIKSRRPTVRRSRGLRSHPSSASNAS